MKKQVKLNEAQLRNMVAGCVEKTLKEFISPVQPATDYEGNDLNYEHLFDDALKVIDEMNDGATEIKWQDVAQRMGYHLDTLNEDDIELLHDAIEDAMAVPGIEKEEPIQVNETKIAKIVAESVKKVLKETELGYDIDNFSGNWGRGQRYNILVNGEVYYHDVSEEEVDRLYDQLASKP